MAKPLAVRDEAARQLKPEMASRRLLVLAFVRDYIDRWGSSPSCGEIAAGVGVSRERARQLVRKLAAAGQLLRTPGPRGLALPEVRDEAVRRLRELGWAVDEDLGVASPPPRPDLSNSMLLDAPPLTYRPPTAQPQEIEDGDEAGEQRGARAPQGVRRSAPGDHHGLGAPPSRRRRRGT